MVKPALRKKSVTTKLAESEYARLELLATATGKNMSEWVREKLLALPTETGMDVLLRELLALRTILINLLFSLAKGESITAEQMHSLIARADQEKNERAIHVLKGESHG
ncbi:MAG: hypothetical protein ACYCOU_01995 [Sulfobacillus sp.]